MEKSLSNGHMNGASDAFLDLNGYSQSSYEQMLGETSYPMEYRGVSPMIAMSSNFHYPTRQEQTADPTGSKPKQNFYYSRHHNPNFSLLEQQVQILHGGSRALVFPTGMGAASSVLISLSRKDSTIVYSDELYHDVPDLLEEMHNNFGWKSFAVDICNTKQVVEKVKEVDARILFLETCSNPSNKVPSLKKLVEQVREVAPKCIIVVDNTFMSPVLFRPLDYGVDIVIESATKYLSGKGDVLLGIAVLRKSKEPNGVLDNALANIGESLHRWRLLSGCSPSPMNCWLVSKGLETLGIRMPHVSSTAMEVALALEKVPCVSRVLYCGLPSHPSHKRAKKLFGDKFSGIIRFHIPGNSVIVGKLQQDSGLVTAVSLGESHTLLPPPHQGHVAVFPGDAKNYPEMSGFWFRIAIGLESANDIKQHLLYAFAAQQELRVELGVVKKINEKKQTMKIKVTDKDLLRDWKGQINNKVVFVVVKDIKRMFFVSLKDSNPKDSSVNLKFPWTAQDPIKDHMKPETQLFTFKNWLPLARECQKIVETK